MSLPVVAIVGRPNVGKSTLFNRLIGERKAITEAVSGVTRDRHYGKAEWINHYYQLIDTGGVVPNSEDIFERAIFEQVRLAIEECDVILFVVDATAGIHPLDSEVAQILRKAAKPVLLIVNKVDNTQRAEQNVGEFYNLGLGAPIPISAINGRSVGDMLDELLAAFPIPPGEPEGEEPLKLAIVGKPNVGKSSFLNSLVGYDRAIVTPIPGTTRDALHTTYTYYGQPITLIDTAGLRRKKYVKDNLELFGALRTMKAIEECDVALVMIDAEQGIENQDAKIINEAIDARKGIVVVVNKWDLIEKDSKTATTFEKQIRETFRTFDYVPVVFISALTHLRHTKPLEIALKVFEARNRRIPTGELNSKFLEEIERIPPPNVRGHDLRINYITQVKVGPPVFAFFSNFPELIPEHYKRFLENKLREMYDFTGVTVSFIFRKK